LFDIFEPPLQLVEFALDLCDGSLRPLAISCVDLNLNVRLTTVRRRPVIARVVTRERLL